MSTPLYSKLGKKYADLWKKGFDTNNKLSWVTKTDGLKLTVDGTVSKDQTGFDGSQQVEYTEKGWGKTEGEIDTSGKIWASHTWDELLDGAEFSLRGGIDPNGKESLYQSKGGAQFEAQYKKDVFAVSGRLVGGYATSKDDHSAAKDPSGRIEVDAVVSYDGLTAGAQLKCPLGDKSKDFKKDGDINIGAQYANKDFTAYVGTTHQTNVIKFSWFHNVSKDLQLGAEIIDDPNKLSGKDAQARTLSFASKYQLNTDTFVKFRANHHGKVAAGVEQVFRDPRMKVTAGATFNAKGVKAFKADKFGLGLTFGDF